MKTLTKTLTILLMLLLAVSCSKDEGLLSTGDELSDVLKGAKAKEIVTPLSMSGWSNYKATVPKTGTVIDLGPLMGDPDCIATLFPDEGHWYVLQLTEIMFPGMERNVEFPIKIAPGGVVTGYWPETWYDWGNPPEGENPDSDLISLITGHLGCDLHGPGVNKGTINFKGTFDGNALEFVFRFNGLDNGIESTYGPGSPWNLIDGPAIFEFSFNLYVD